MEEKEWDLRKYQRESLYKIVIAVLVFLLLLRQCGSKHGEPTVKVERYVDTTYIKGEEVIVPFYDTIIETITVFKPTPPDTIYVVPNGAVVEYNTKVEDSLLSGTINTMIELPSKNLLTQTFTYKPLFPKYITRVDTVKIKDSIVTTIMNQRSLLYGGGLGASPDQLSLRVYGGFRNKVGKELLYGYDILQKSHNLAVIIPLKK